MTALEFCMKINRLLIDYHKTNNVIINEIKIEPLILNREDGSEYIYANKLGFGLTTGLLHEENTIIASAVLSGELKTEN